MHYWPFAEERVRLGDGKKECPGIDGCDSPCCTRPCGSPVCCILGCRHKETVRIHKVDDELQCRQRLAELGIVEGEEVMVLKHSDPLLLLARDTRIAIDRATAARIEVAYEPAF
jgi:Fe2+ transport system protein FeoA